MKKTLISLFSIMVLAAFVVGCDKPNDLPPKTDQTTTSYLLPKGERLTLEERAAVNQAKDEYYQAIDE